MPPGHERRGGVWCNRTVGLSNLVTMLFDEYLFADYSGVHSLTLQRKAIRLAADPMPRRCLRRPPKGCR